MESAVYILCALTALGCALLLLRGYYRSRLRLLLWCGIFFAALTLENIVLFVDLVVTGPAIDLSLWRTSLALAGTMVLLYGLIWDVK